MIKIKTQKIEEAVYNLCISANTCYDVNLYNKIYEKYKKAKTVDLKNKYADILRNIELSKNSRRPLCQDTGQIIVFVELGQNILLEGKPLNKAINDAVEKAYKENFFRKSVVKNSLFDRNNTNTNTPAIIYTEISDINGLNLSLLVKGAGSENYSAIKMFQPSSSKEEIFEFVKEAVLKAGEKSCPPLVLGLGAGATMDKAAVMSKKAFFKESQTNEETVFIEELKDYLKDLSEDLLEIKLETDATHIACLPIALTINCHSTRHAKCIIFPERIYYKTSEIEIKSTDTKNLSLNEINLSNIDEIDKLKNLKKGEHVLLTGEIYTARDAAHKKIADYYQKTGTLPFELKDKIIFYAGPCPAAPNEIIGPVGPTTSARMDKFCNLVYSQGLLATIGKGERSKETEETIKNYNGKYLTTQGGIACLLSKCVKQSEVVAFEELGTEAVRKLYVEKFPVCVEI